MFYFDIDGGVLAWAAKDGDPALVLTEEYDQNNDQNRVYYWVRLVGVTGNIATQTRYDSAKQALRAFAELLPE